MSTKNKSEAGCDLKWAIRAVAAARENFFSNAYIDRLTEIENLLIDFRNEILQIKPASPVAGTGDKEAERE